jgi:hypothetical protein
MIYYKPKTKVYHEHWKLSPKFVISISDPILITYSNPDSTTKMRIATDKELHRLIELVFSLKIARSENELKQILGIK